MNDLHEWHELPKDDEGIRCLCVVWKCKNCGVVHHGEGKLEPPPVDMRISTGMHGMTVSCHERVAALVLES